METERTRVSGFASMDTGKQREIARKGGMAAHRKGTAHEFTTEEARAAGRKGGESVSTNRAHMANIGRLGGKRSAERRRAKPSGESATSTATGHAQDKSSNDPDSGASHPAAHASHHS